jgi:dienelactone hydrolase
VKPALLLIALAIQCLAQSGPPLEGTQPLTVDGDLSARMVEGIDRWLMRETDRVAKERKLDVKVGEPLKNARELLRARLGMVDARVEGEREDAGNLGVSSRAPEYSVKAIRWPVFDDVWAQGALYEPKVASGIAVILIDDPGHEPNSPRISAERLVEQGCTVLVPKLVGRGSEYSGNPRIARQTPLSHREWIYRPAFEVGRTLIGYEVESVLAVIPHIAGKETQLGICGHGEGAVIAQFAAALEPRFQSVLISGQFGPRERLWEEPIYRNISSLLRDFGDAELAGMADAKSYIVEYSLAPPLPIVTKRGIEAPGKLATPSLAAVEAEVQRSQALRAQGPSCTAVQLVKGADGRTVGPGSDEALAKFLAGLGKNDALVSTGVSTVWLEYSKGAGIDEKRIVRDLETHTQTLLRYSEKTRYKQPLWAKLKPGPEYDAVRNSVRKEFWEKVIGKISTDYVPPNPRSRQIHDKEKWRGYDVMLDVHADIFAWGVLLVPKDLKQDERRPVVVCQHGLEGLPEDTITDDPKSKGYGSYKAFAAKLCERGFIVYVPHNPYRGWDKFRVLQRKANPLGLSLFSFIIAQHDVTTKWLASLPFVDPERIGFYGLSYGGKTAMRVPAVLDRYCLSICSADFNDWVTKNATTEHGFSYVFTNEYEIFEWDLAHTFNYAEMALLIAPRPFMVERGHDDGVGTSEHVGYEFAKVRRGYDKLGIGERAEIEWFNGPHTINGVGTFKFLHKWLRWPE